MSRRTKAEKRDRLPDPRFGSPVVTQFINGLMTGGKKSVAERIFYSAIESIDKKTNDGGIEVFQKALNNVKPMLEVKSRRVGGANYQVPIEVRPARRLALAIRWLIAYSTSRSENTMSEKLAAEFMAASRGEGTSVKKKEDTHKMAEANKAFAHFRW
ncbi:MAG: 30S ribosomal protein S7 [candidate division Zixibacteria bacterium]